MKRGLRKPCGRFVRFPASRSRSSLVCRGTTRRISATISIGRRSLPCALRVYHCVVLPSALMVRSPPEHQLVYDPVSLKLHSCLGWPADALAREVEFLTGQAKKSGGRAGQYFWVFPPPGMG